MKEEYVKTKRTIKGVLITIALSIIIMIIRDDFDPSSLTPYYYVVVILSIIGIYFYIKVKQEVDDE